MSLSETSGTGAYSERIPDCKTCGDTGWLCAGTTNIADFTNGTCCRPWESEEFDLGRSCPSADGCPDCDRALAAVPETDTTTNQKDTP